MTNLDQALALKETSRVAAMQKPAAYAGAGSKTAAMLRVARLIRRTF